MSENKKIGIDNQVRSSLQEELTGLLEQATQKRRERRREIQGEVNKEHHELATLEQYDMTTKQKMDYMYKVKPHLYDIGEMLSKGATKGQIAKSLGVSYVALKAMMENIPEVAEVFYVADLEMIDLAEASMHYLAQSRVTEKQELDRFGTVHTLQEFKEPDFRAAKFILERRDPRYSDRKVIEHQATMSDELQEILENFSIDEITELEKRMADEEDIIEAEYEEHE